MFGSRPSFFRIGVTTAFLNSSGTIAETKERLMIFTIMGRSASRHSLRRCVGIGSKGQDLEADARISFLTSSHVAGEKL